ncbi:hypothetical protein ACPTFI_14605, partial [Enterococcus faecium]|uniref:hypothetical protein n=1 Tax=Enterococcus faecium TaxID=1352 RepID=UPI003CC67036
IAPEKVIKQFGADFLRFWVSSVDYEADVRDSMDILSQVAEVYRKIRNTMRFLLAITEDFDPNKDTVSYNDLRSVDKYMT